MHAIEATLWAVWGADWRVFGGESTPKSWQCVLSKPYCVLCGGTNGLVLLLKANRSKCSVHSQSSIVGCVGVQVGDFLIVENTQKSLQCVLSKPHWGLRGGANG